MSFQPSTDPFGACLLGLSVVGAHPRQTNDATVASVRSIFSKNHDYKSYFCVILGSTGAWWQKTTNRQTHTHTRDNYKNPRCACAPRVTVVDTDDNENLKGLSNVLCVHTGSSVLYFNTRPTSVLQINTHIIYCIPHIPDIACTIAMAFLDCIPTSSLNL